MSSGHSIDHLHVRFNFGVLSSCCIDVFDRCHLSWTIKVEAKLEEGQMECGRVVIRVTVHVKVNS